MPTLQVLRPNVTREEASEQFSRGLPGWLRRATQGPLRLLADVYVPFYLFRIEITNGRRTEARVMGIDAIVGSLDPYEFDDSDSAQLTLIDSSNFLPPRLPENQAAQQCVEKVRRILFNRGFFRMQHPSVAASYACKIWWVPYWVAFYGKDSALSLSVIDAVRRRFEGAKVRALLKDWLQEECPAAAEDHGPAVTG